MSGGCAKRRERMVKREIKAGELQLTFVLPKDQHEGRVSVVGDFNGWTPGVHTLMRRSNGTRSVKVAVPPGAAYKFRYLAEGGHWFDDPQVDARDNQDGVVFT
jgi:1,4-alpha-glucan branching enzyme